MASRANRAGFHALWTSLPPSSNADRTAEAISASSLLDKRVFSSIAHVIWMMLERIAARSCVAPITCQWCAVRRARPAADFARKKSWVVFNTDLVFSSSCFPASISIPSSSRITTPWSSFGYLDLEARLVAVLESNVAALRGTIRLNDVWCSLKVSKTFLALLAGSSLACKAAIWISNSRLKNTSNTADGLTPLFSSSLRLLRDDR
mmetsp:Transcript_5875/g.11122  ORF Transcript_5875/g.11122 Transcript_5875/m.11122 type:complete len:206 (+) Transcript_5875:382-999(+)